MNSDEAPGFITVAVYERLLDAARAERRMREARLTTMRALVGAIADGVNHQHRHQCRCRAALAGPRRGRPG